MHSIVASGVREQIQQNRPNRLFRFLPKHQPKQSINLLLQIVIVVVDLSSTHRKHPPSADGDDWAMEEVDTSKRETEQIPADGQSSKVIE
ncbi:hypothetical protein BLNAU_15977 [Blattamonas nauphoetae]|uniref:Uncharacterized protein n=1 Tax=Blattamonas nauphoetae TaxID=2049346 RepID=A0ABQ9XFS5_9EUKA|nr:hypothetical protein BLNAU_15977 [Blattamonas nauphoetae]